LPTGALALTSTIVVLPPTPTMSPVSVPPFHPPDLIARFEAAGRAAGFRVESMGAIAPPGLPPAAVPCSLLALTKRTPGRRPRIYVSAGIHGDEPAPPLALLELLEAGFFDARATWFLCPLLNPAGFLRATRENADGIDLNRDYKATRSAEIAAHRAWLTRQPNFDLTLCLHEDWEATGYYLYELNPLGRRSLARPIIEAVGAVMPVEPAAVIDGRPIDEPGIIRPDADPLLRDLWPESIYLRAHHTTLGYTLESSSARPLAQRIAAHRLALATAVAGVLGAH